MLGIKFILSLSIFLITTYMGIEMARGLKSREEILTDMVTFLRLLKNEMTYMNHSIPVAFEVCRQKLISELKNSIGAIVLDIEEYGIGKVDMSINNNIDSLSALSFYDKSVIISTLKNIGRSDLESQNNIIENGITILNEQIKEANAYKIKNSKVYKTVGVISGLIIVVIFI